MTKLASGMSKKELTRLSKRLSSLNDVNQEDDDIVIGVEVADVEVGIENDPSEDDRFVAPEGGQCG